MYADAVVHPSAEKESRRRVPKVVHLSDIHFPLFKGDAAWRRQWEAVTARVREQSPQLVIITGDVINSATPEWRARRRLSAFFEKHLREQLHGIDVISVPGNHDIKAFFGLFHRNRRAATEFQRLTGDLGGWHEPIDDRIHLFTIDSNHSPSFARGRISERDLDRAVIPTECAGRHLHIFALHHGLVIEPVREGERSLTSSDSTLGTDDAERIIEKVAAFGFDLVLHGHRHLSTFHYYAGPLAERRSDGCLIVGAPSATKPPWQGFNIITAGDDGAFEVEAVFHAQGRWLPPQLVASRDYEEKRTRHWSRHAKGLQPSCDSAEVSIETYAEGDERTRLAQRVGGDVKVTVTLHRPKNLPRTSIAFPLESVVGYKGFALRGVTAYWTDVSNMRRQLKVNAEGRLDMENVDPDALAIEVTAVLLNAVPTLPGDWDRMKASQPDLRDVIDVRLTMPARFLRLRTALQGFSTLQSVARDTDTGERLLPEGAFMAVHVDADTDSCSQEIITFRPFGGIRYCLTSSADPIGGPITSMPVHASTIMERLAAPLPSTVAARVQQKLDMLQSEIVTIARSVPGASGSGDDISADLLAIRSGRAQGGISVVMTDRLTAARFQDSAVKGPVGATLEWGRGVAGRALRLQQWVGWRRERHETSHESAWPPREWYHEIEGHGTHTSIYCGPLETDVDGKRFMIGMLSFASQQSQSLLDHLISALRDEEKYPNAAAAFLEAVRKFSIWLGVAIVEGAYNEHHNDN